MKQILYMVSILLVTSCTNQTDTDKTETQMGDDTTQYTIDTLLNIEVTDSMPTFTKNDLTEMGIKGQVKSMTIHSNDVDEEGAQTGMGGMYEKYTFSEHGFISTIEIQGCCGYELERIIYNYNSKHQLTDRVFYRDGTAEYFNKEKYFYDDNGVLVKIKVAEFDQKLDEDITFKYNEDGEVIKKETYNVSKNEIETITYTYSDLKDTKTYTRNSDDKTSKEVLIYDGEGHIIEREMHLSNSSIQQQQFTYEYDSIGNWITKMDKLRYILEDGSKEKWRKSTKETREIEYY